MQRFLLEVRIYPDSLECKNCGGDLKETENSEGYDCPDCGRFYEPVDVKAAADKPGEVTPEELASVLANSTASEALAAALSSTIEWEVLPETATGAFKDNILATALRQIIEARDRHAQTGDYGEDRPYECFDDWAADVAESALRAFRPNPLGPIVVTVEGGVVQDVTGLPAGLTYVLHDIDEDDHDEDTCPHCGRSDDPYDVASVVFPKDGPKTK